MSSIGTINDPCCVNGVTPRQTPCRRHVGFIPLPLVTQAGTSNRCSIHNNWTRNLLECSSCLFKDGLLRKTCWDWTAFKTGLEVYLPMSIWKSIIQLICFDVFTSSALNMFIYIQITLLMGYFITIMSLRRWSYECDECVLVNFVYLLQGHIASFTKL